MLCLIYVSYGSCAVLVFDRVATLYTPACLSSKMTCVVAGGSDRFLHGWRAEHCKCSASSGNWCSCCFLWNSTSSSCRSSWGQSSSASPIWKNDTLKGLSDKEVSFLFPLNTQEGSQEMSSRRRLILSNDRAFEEIDCRVGIWTQGLNPSWLFRILLKGLFILAKLDSDLKKAQC